MQVDRLDGENCDNILPEMVIWPARGFKKPDNVRSNVVLPEPLGPIIQYKRPRLKFKLISDAITDFGFKYPMLR